MEALLQIHTTNHPTLQNVSLKLEFETRILGAIETTGEGTFITSRRAKHLFRKTKSLGFNYSLLTDSRFKFKFITIQYQDESGAKRILETTRKYFLFKGKCFQFCKKGFELQTFLPLSEFGLNKALQFEKGIDNQKSLFDR